MVLFVMLFKTGQKKCGKRALIKPNLRYKIIFPDEIFFIPHKNNWGYDFHAPALVLNHNKYYGLHRCLLEIKCFHFP